MASSQFNVNRPVYSGVFEGNQNIEANSRVDINIPIYGDSIILQPQYYSYPSDLEATVLQKNTNINRYVCRVKNNTSSQISSTAWKIYWIQT